MTDRRTNVRQITLPGGVRAVEYRDTDPDNKIVTRTAVIPKDTVGRMYAKGQITYTLMEAARLVCRDAEMSGMYKGMKMSRLDRTEPGLETMTERSEDAWRRLESLFQRLDDFGESCAEFVVIGGYSLSDWAAVIRNRYGVAFNRHHAAGVLKSSLHTAAVEYGLQSRG